MEVRNSQLSLAIFKRNLIIITTFTFYLGLALHVLLAIMRYCLILTFAKLLLIYPGLALLAGF